MVVPQYITFAAKSKASPISSEHHTNESPPQSKRHTVKQVSMASCPEEPSASLQQPESLGGWAENGRFRLKMRCSKRSDFRRKQREFSTMDINNSPSLPDLGPASHKIPFNPNSREPHEFSTIGSLITANHASCFSAQSITASLTPEQSFLSPDFKNSYNFRASTRSALTASQPSNHQVIANDISTIGPTPGSQVGYGNSHFLNSDRPGIKPMPFAQKSLLHYNTPTFQGEIQELDQNLGREASKSIESNHLFCKDIDQFSDLEEDDEDFFILQLPNEIMPEYHDKSGSSPGGSSRFNGAAVRNPM